jgi:hypothetical protein
MIICITNKNNKIKKKIEMVLWPSDRFGDRVVAAISPP